MLLPAVFPAGRSSGSGRDAHRCVSGRLSSAVYRCSSSCRPPALRPLPSPRACLASSTALDAKAGKEKGFTYPAAEPQVSPAAAHQPAAEPVEIEEPPPAAFVLRAAEPTDAGTLGSFLMRVLHKRARKAKKLQKAALAASGEAQADATYALRLELRRLRSDLALSSLALRLPADTAPRLLTPALRRLGAPRDAAVIQSVLRTSAAAASPAEPEAARLAALLAGLRAAQEAAFAAALPTLRPNGRPARLVARLTRALAEGEEALGRRLARQPAPDGAVRLLSAAAAELFAHPAWSLALAPTAPPRAGARAWEAALGARARACARLHALRKALREFRYALMSVQKLYKAAGGATEAAFSATLRAVAEMQGHLGDCHDAEVACQALGGSPADDFPATSAELRRRREEAAARLRGCAAAALCAGGQRDFYAALTGLGAAGDTSAEIADEITI